MLTKQDCILLLATLPEGNYDKSELTAIKNLAITSKTINIDVLKFINKHKGFEVSNFYEYLRKSYNHKKSKLYGNIVKEISDTQEVLITLSALLTQILLYSKNCKDKELFLKHTRAEEISKTLTMYFTDFEISKAIQLLVLIKADLKCFELINNDK